MTKLADRYHLRLTARFGFYDANGTNMWHEFETGAVVSDQSLIQTLEARGAPTEQIFEGAYRR